MKIEAGLPSDFVDGSPMQLHPDMQIVFSFGHEGANGRIRVELDKQNHCLRIYTPDAGFSIEPQHANDLRIELRERRGL